LFASQLAFDAASSHSILTGSRYLQLTGWRRVCPGWRDSRI
jgi:hypothetical protein